MSLTVTNKFSFDFGEEGGVWTVWTVNIIVSMVVRDKNT